MFFFILTVSSFFTFLLFGTEDGAGIFFGMLWGYVNFHLIKQLTAAWFADKKKHLKIILFILIKFPFLYFIGFILLKNEHISSWNLLIGFSISLIVCVQKNIRKLKKLEEKKAVAGETRRSTY